METQRSKDRKTTLAFKGHQKLFLCSYTGDAGSDSSLGCNCPCLGVQVTLDNHLLG